MPLFQTCQDFYKRTRLKLAEEKMDVATSYLVDKLGEYIGNILGDIIPDAEIFNWYKKNINLKDYLKLFYKYKNERLEAYLSYYKGKQVYSIITKTPSYPEDLYLTEEHLLQPSGTIPPLYLWIGIQKSNDKIIQNTTAAHNNFIVEFFKALGYGDDLISDFLETNKNKINQLRSSFKQKPERLGQGADGTAYQISQSLVLKLFFDKGAYDHALKSIDKLHNHPELANTEAMIYDAGELGLIGKTPVYYYIIEKMQPVSNSAVDSKNILRTILHVVVNQIYVNRQLTAIKEQINNTRHHAYLKEKIRMLSFEFSNKVRKEIKKSQFQQIEMEYNLSPGWLEHFIEEIIVKYLTDRRDLHLGNLGITNYGYLKYFDPIFGAGQLTDINIGNFN